MWKSLSTLPMQAARDPGTAVVVKVLKPTTLFMPMQAGISHDCTGGEAPVRRRGRGNHIRALVLSTKRPASIQRRLALPEIRVAFVPHSSCSRETVGHRTKPATTGWNYFNGSKKDEAWYSLAAAAFTETAYPLRREPCYSFVFFRPCRSCCKRQREAWWGV